MGILVKIENLDFVKYDLKISEIARSKKIKYHNSTLECQANRGVETLSVVVV